MARGRSGKTVLAMMALSTEGREWRGILLVKGVPTVEDSRIEPIMEKGLLS